MKVKAKDEILFLYKEVCTAYPIDTIFEVVSMKQYGNKNWLRLKIYGCIADGYYNPNLFEVVEQ